MRLTTLFFDLDGTVYPEANGLWEAIGYRMEDYMHVRLGLPRAEIPRLRHIYYEEYGTTLRGLQANFQVDSEDYLAYVHELPLENYLQPDPHLNAMLMSLPQERWIFTNADNLHAQRVLSALQIEDCFTGIIDVKALGYLCKPDPKAYLKALALAGATNPVSCAMIDDSARNLAAGGSLGLYTILIGQPDYDFEPDTHLGNLKELPTRLPELWGHTVDV